MYFVLKPFSQDIIYLSKWSAHKNGSEMRGVSEVLEW